MKQSYKLTDGFISAILQSCSGYLRPGDLDRFFDKLDTEIRKYAFTQSAENNLLRIIQSSFDRTLLISESLKYPLFLDIILTASVNSNYICDILVRDPEFFYWVSNPSVLNTKVTPGYLGENISEIMSRYNSFQAKVNAIKSLKRKEILRIGLQDLLGIYPLEIITSELSDLAVSVLDHLFILCYNETEKKYSKKFDISYSIVSLGKLGGHELNYSSDTDIIIFFDKEKKLATKYASEYLTEIVKLFIESSSKLTDNGYLYRIDFRLRPDGRNSALCRTINEYLDYYETRGEQWERQMLIKAGFLSGDYDLYKKFISYVTPFIYPVSHLVSPAEEVYRLKSSIEKNLKDDLNIKLARGGIRDIEFAVQVLQLLYGGKNKNLRTGSTLEALKALCRYKLISEKEEEILISAYTLYRKIEHYLQLMNDRQVHTIPEKGDIAERMSVFLGYKTIISFHNDLKEKRNAVRKIYLSIIPAGKDDDSSAVEIFKNKQQSERSLKFLKEGKDLTGEKAFDQKTRNAFLEFEPLMYRMISEFPDPDQLLQNFTSLIKSSQFPSIWYEELLDEIFCRYFFSVCAYSTKAVSFLAASPGLQDFVLTRKVFAEYSATELSSFSLNKMLLYLLVKLSLKKIEPDELSALLSDYCAASVKSITEKTLGLKEYFVAGMGSFGSGDMSFGSDIDLIFVVNNGSAEYEKKFQGLLKKLNKELNLFKPDCRLRPEGKTSQLSWDIKAYFRYLETRARIWELQSLCRIRFIAGDEKLYSAFISKVHERIEKENCADIKKSVLDMRKKLHGNGLGAFSKNIDIKKSRGGLTDIEFILQYLILCNPDLFDQCRGKNIPGIINVVISRKPETADLEKLKTTAAYLKRIELLTQSAFDTDKTYFPGEENRKKIIAAYLNKKSSELDSEFRNALQTNSSIFEKYFS